MKWAALRHLITGVNDCPEMGRVLFGLMGLAYIAYQGVAIFLLKQAFAPMEFATGAGALLAGGGGGIALKDRGVAAARAQEPSA